MSHTAITPALTVLVTEHAYEWMQLLGWGFIAYATTCHYIPLAAPKLFARGLYGLDINKTTSEERVALRNRLEQQRKDVPYADLSPQDKKKIIPESLGIVAGAVYLTVLLLLLVSLRLEMRDFSGPLASIVVMLLLGFVDDVLNVRWRYKIILSAVGSLPLLMSYQGSLFVLIPRPVLILLSYVSNLSLFKSMSQRPWVGVLLHYFPSQCFQVAVEKLGNDASFPFSHCLLYLGPLYMLYISMLCIFCTNSINILAGVNGVEVGQSIIIAVASIIFNSIEYRLDPALAALSSDMNPTTGIDEQLKLATHRLHALVLLVPFVGVSLAIWKFNRFPSRVFVGDSYTYFAGTVLSVASISGLYTKTLMLLFIPQLLNFIISLPQLFGFIPCPPHRVPTWCSKTGKLKNSGNLTLLNTLLLLFGGKDGMSEANLTKLALLFQVLMCTLGLAVRFALVSYFYPH